MRWLKVYENHDMRKRHQLRESLAARRLKPGQCIIAINRSRTIARIIDAAGGVHEYYEAAGLKIDLPRLQAMVREGWGITLTGSGIRLRKKAS